MGIKKCYGHLSNLSQCSLTKEWKRVTILLYKSEVNRYVTILYLLGRYSGLYRLVSVKRLFLCFLSCTQRKWKSLGFCFIQRDCRNCFSHYISRISNMGLGNHPILKFDLSNISHLWRRCSFASDPRTWAKESGSLNDRDGTGHRKFSVLVLFLLYYIHFCV